MNPTPDQINACSDRVQLAKWQAQFAGTIWEREIQAIKNRIDAINQEDASVTLARIEANLLGIHEHARKPEYKTWAFLLAVISLVVAVIALCRDFYNWQPKHQEPSPSPSPSPSANGSKRKTLSAPPTHAETPPVSKDEGKGESKTPSKSPTGAKKEGQTSPNDPKPQQNRESHSDS
jgi:hypothetical protein